MPRCLLASWTHHLVLCSLLVTACSCHGARTDSTQALAAAAPPAQGPEYVQTLGRVTKKQRPVSRSARAWFGRAAILPHQGLRDPHAPNPGCFLAYADGGSAIDVLALPGMPYHLACDERATTCCFAHDTDAGTRIGTTFDPNRVDYANADLAAVFAIGVTGSMVRAIACTNGQRLVVLEGLVRDSRLTVTDTATPQAATADLVVAHADDRFTYCYVKPDSTHAVRWISSRTSREFSIGEALVEVVPDGERFLGFDAAGRLYSIESGGVYAVTLAADPVTNAKQIASGVAGTFAYTNGTPPRVIRIVNRTATAVGDPVEVLELAAADSLWAAIAGTPFPTLSRWDAAAGAWQSLGRFEGLRLLTPDGPGLLQAHDNGTLNRWNSTATTTLGGRLPLMSGQSPKIEDLGVNSNGNTTRVWIVATANDYEHLYRW